jgi:hypothetical protein
MHSYIITTTIPIPLSYPQYSHIYLLRYRKPSVSYMPQVQNLMEDNLLSTKPGGDQVDVSIFSSGLSDSFSCDVSGIEPVPYKSEKTVFNAEKLSSDNLATVKSKNCDLVEVYLKAKKRYVLESLILRLYRTLHSPCKIKSKNVDYETHLKLNSPDEMNYLFQAPQSSKNSVIIYPYNR